MVMEDKKKVWETMKPQISEIVEQWDSDGIIIETQFVVASQHFITSSLDYIYEIIVENGGHEVAKTEDDELKDPIGHAIEIEFEGWQYCFFDPNMIKGIFDVNRMMIEYFKNRL